MEVLGSSLSGEVEGESSPTYSELDLDLLGRRPCNNQRVFLGILCLKVE